MTEARARRRLALGIATCAGLGYFPGAPGTAGAVLGLGIVAALGRAPLTANAERAMLAGAAAGIYAAGVWAAGITEQVLGRRDPANVVIDEVAGQIAAFLLRPAAPWKWLIAGFVLFRIFDVVKPAPARRSEHLPGGWGIMTDDLVAAAYTGLVLAALGYVAS